MFIAHHHAKYKDYSSAKYSTWQKSFVAKIVRNWHGCPYSGVKPWWGGGGGYGATPGKSRERWAL